MSTSIGAVHQQLTKAVSLHTSNQKEEAYVEYLNCANRISDILRPALYQLSAPQPFLQEEEQLQRLFHFGRECLFQCEKIYMEKLEQRTLQQTSQASAPLLTITQINSYPTTTTQSLSGSFSAPNLQASSSSSSSSPSLFPFSPSQRFSPSPSSPSPYFYPIASESTTPRSATPSTVTSTGSASGWTVINVKPRFKDREIEQLQKQFEAMDFKTRDGKVTVEEFSHCVGCLPLGVDKRKGSVLSDFIWRPKCKLGSYGFNSRLFKVFDQNKSTFIEFEDYKTTLGILLHGTREEQLQWSFFIFDHERRGYFSKEEFLQVLYLIADNLEHMGFTFYSNRQFCTRQFLTIFEAMSSNGKIVTKNEFITYNSQKPFVLGSLGIISPNQHFAIRKLPKSGFAVAPGHSSWNKMLNMMLGIRSSQEQANWLFTKGLIGNKQHHQSSFEEYLVREQDFSLCISINLPPLIDTYSVYRDAYNLYVFTDYAPVIFKKIRSLFGISEEEYMMSLSPEQLFGHLLQGQLTCLSEKITEGKSGNFFFYSYNGLFLCKTISAGELNTFRRVLPYYYQHICEHPDTLLCRFYGLHQLNNIAFVVMGNVFETDYKMKEVFDLKGSTYKRTNPDPKGVRKDLDFIELKRKLKIGEPRKTQLLNQLASDAKLLETMQIIDYSLLVGIADNPDAELIPVNHGNITRVSSNVSNRKRVPLFQTFDGGLLSEDGKEIYYLGIIDTLIEYGMLKFAEHQIKSIIQGNDISVIEPKDYCIRFVKFMQQSIE